MKRYGSTRRFKAIRGGDWYEMARYRRPVNRGLLIPLNDQNLVGFRCCRSAEYEEAPSMPSTDVHRRNP